MSRTSNPRPSPDPSPDLSPRRRLVASLAVAAAVTGIVVVVPSTLGGAGAGRDSSVVISEDAEGAGGGNEDTETDRPDGTSRSGLRSMPGSGADAKTPPDLTAVRRTKQERTARTNPTGSTSPTSGASRRLLRSIEAAAAKAAERDRAAERRAAQEGQEDGPTDGAAYDVSGNRALGLRLMLDFGFGSEQWPALEALWTRESGWNHLADNPTSSAYGIPQSLPGSKMASAGPDWATNPSTQIRWGLGYIAARYGSPKAALAHSDSVGWY